jgi:Leucine Rich repeat
MSYEEILPSVRILSRIDKLRLIQVLTDDLVRAEEGPRLAAGQTSAITAPAGTTSGRRWKYLRLNLQGLMVVVLVIGAALGWLVRSTRIQRHAVEAIENAGGDVSYDWEWSDGHNTPGGEPWAPRWLVGLIGADFFGHVTVVQLAYKDADSVMAQVARLNRTQVLGLGRSMISDSELARIDGNLTHLLRVNLAGTRVTDAGLVHLQTLTKLDLLDLSGTQVSDAGLVHLQGLTKLDNLDLSETQVSDAGLPHLRKLQNISFLNLGRTRVSDAGLIHLASLSKLSSLYLTGTRVTDAGLAHLKGLVRLSQLSLRGTKVTDAGLKMLEQVSPNLSITRPSIDFGGFSSPLTPLSESISPDRP